jgi:hypothetical protein
MSAIIGAEDNEFQVLLLRPHYPVIIVSADRLKTAARLKELALDCLTAIPISPSTHITVIDADGKEFSYFSEKHFLLPAWNAPRPWSKKRMVDLYNQSINAREIGEIYPERSLNNKSVTQVVTDLCALIKSSNRRRK